MDFEQIQPCAFLLTSETGYLSRCVNLDLSLDVVRATDPYLFITDFSLLT
jgi:hypothetical protein